MNRTKTALLFLAALGSALAGLSAPVWADDDPPAARPPAMRGQPDGTGCPCGMMEHGCGMGMMGGGMGMMGGGMGMMGGGHGMMGEHGMMAGSHRMHMVLSLNLSDEQRAKINRLYDDLRHRNWDKEGQVQDEHGKLRDLWEADKRDPKAIGAEYQKIFDLKRQMIEATADTQNRVEALLTPDQLKQLKEKHHGMGMADCPMMH